MIAISQCANCIKADVCNQKEKYDELLEGIGKVTLLNCDSDGQFSTKTVEDTPEFEAIVRCAHFFNAADPASQKTEKRQNLDETNLANTNFAKITESPKTLARFIMCQCEDEDMECPEMLHDLTGVQKCKQCTLKWLNSPWKADKQDE